MTPSDVTAPSPCAPSRPRPEVEERAALVRIDVSSRLGLLLLRLVTLLGLATGRRLTGLHVEQRAARCGGLRLDLRVGFRLGGRRLRIRRGAGDVEKGASVGDGRGLR